MCGTEFYSLNTLCSFLYPQSLEQCLARGRTRVLFKAWHMYELKYLSNERITFYPYCSKALSSINPSFFRLVTEVYISQVFKGFKTC